MLQNLGGDIAVHACTFLDAKDLSACACACSDWKNALRRNGRRINRLLWNTLTRGLEPLWASGRTYKSLNRYYWCLVHSNGSAKYQTSVFDDKITGFHLHRSIEGEHVDVWCMIDFSGNASVVQIETGIIIAEQKLYLEDGTSGTPSYTCSVVIDFKLGHGEGKQLFVCGTKAGELAVFSMEQFKGRRHYLSNSHIRSMCPRNSCPAEIFVGDGSGCVRLARVVNNGPGYGIEVLHSWDLFDLAQLHLEQKRLFMAVTCLRTRGSTTVCCTKKSGIFVFAETIKGSSEWTLVNHIDQSWLGERFLTCMEFLSDDEVIVGTRGASFTGNDSRIIKMLKDNCCFGVRLHCKNADAAILWSLPINRTVFSILPISYRKVMVSVDYGGLQIWDTKERKQINCFNPLEGSQMHFANLTPHNHRDSVCATVEGEILEIEWSNKLYTKK